MGLSDLVHTSKWKAFMAKLYGWGASVVIVGALFKIQHYPGAGLFLGIGLLTEATIFFFSAFEPLKEDPDWKLVYPQLDPNYTGPEFGEGFAVGGGGYGGGGYIGEGGGGGAVGIGGGGISGGTSLTGMDRMLANAGITPELFEKLSQGLKKLSDTTEHLNSLGDVALTTSEYHGTIKKANESLLSLSQSYLATAKAMSETSGAYQMIGESSKNIEEGGRSYQEKLESLNKNLSALNAVYELQLRGANEHVKNADNIYKDIEGMMKNLTSSADQTQRYKDQVDKLNDNLAALNNVYGSMLSAINVK
ncbi:MAG TPA: gliding motility protein GldL [Bacteroidales bacterium]|nr:gliding motility protein GldL [Bacteroidales bacterium]